MKSTSLLALFILFTSHLSIAQNTHYPTQNESHIFWQPDTKITTQDYQGPPIPYIDSLMHEYGFTASASVGIWCVLDVPEKKKDKYKKFEKVYFAPAFEKTTSYFRTEDTLQIEMQNLYFDICELWARWARKELNALQTKTNATGTISIYFVTIKEEMNKNKIAMYRDYFKDVFIDKIDGGFERWRKDIDNTLEDSTMWATTPEECYRLMTGVPIEDGYIMAPTLIGNLFPEKK